MKVNSLILENFRKFKKSNFEFSQSFNVITGKNGSGKTSILESIYILSTGKSFVTNHISNCITFGEEYSLISARFEENNHEEKMDFLLSHEKREIKYDGRKISRFSEVIGHFPVLVLNYTLLELVTGGPEKRRDFLNHTLIFTNPGYYKLLLRYYSLLDRRNYILRSDKNDKEVLMVLSEELVSIGSPIRQQRGALINDIQSLIDGVFFKISGEKSDIRIVYKPSPLEKLESLEVQEEERQKKKTLYGVHLDDIDVFFDGKDAREYSSIGEAYSLAFALRFVERELIKRKKGGIPVMLLDDFFVDLDEEKRENILKLVSGDQVFITTLSLSNLPSELVNYARVIVL